MQYPVHILSPVTFSKGMDWLGCFPSGRFLALTNLDLKSLSGYQEHLVPYLMKRGVSNDVSMETLVREDLFHLAHALSVLFEKETKKILQNMLGNYIFLIEGYRLQIDHIGRELFGPLSFYLPLLKRMAPQLGLIYLKDLVFPSTQVLKKLQQHDSSLQGVTIGRAYFQNINNGIIKCLELFQASFKDGKFPQNIEATKDRLSLLTKSQSNSLITPIDHLSLELNTIEEVEFIHNRIHDSSSETLLPYHEKISYNPGDGSTQTKALMRHSKTACLNRIIEFVYYEVKK